MVETPGSTRWEMPGQVFPPKSFDPCAIAGERFMAASKARVVLASKSVFISVLRDIGCGFEPADPAALIQRAAAMAVGRFTDAMLRKTATAVFLFQSEHRRTSPPRPLRENRRG